MTIDEAIRYCKEQVLEQAKKGCYSCAEEHQQLAEWLKELKAYKENTCGDAVSRQAVAQVLLKYAHSTEGKAFAEFLVSQINELPSVTPQQRTGRWILADEQNKEDVENDNYRFICSECQCSDIHAKSIKVPYCWKCGAKMEVEDI